MNLLPVRRETIVSSLSAEEVMDRINSITSPATRSVRDTDNKIRFVGSVDQSNFRVSLKVNTADNFLPLIYGRIDKTSLGCIVYLRFKLFFSSLLFLTFWSAICILLSILFFTSLNKTEFGFLILMVGILNYGLTIGFFQRKVNQSYKTFMQELKMQD